MIYTQSHPAWVCGLKPSLTDESITSMASHPAWVCGLKHRVPQRIAKFGFVTPCVGVWIETVVNGRVYNFNGSHPAWVCGLKRSQYPEISDCMCHTLRGCVDWNIDINYTRPTSNSHTLRGCVDWNRNGQRYCYYGKVTPCVGVWIETPYRENISHYFRSHPAWVCGLKLIVVVRHCLFFWSHPAWVCGLKHRAGFDWLLYTESHPAWVCGLKHWYGCSISRF